MITVEEAHIDDLHEKNLITPEELSVLEEFAANNPLVKKLIYSYKCQKSLIRHVKRLAAKAALREIDLMMEIKDLKEKK